MKRLTCFSIMILVSCLFVLCTSSKKETVSEASGLEWPDGLPVYDHIVIVVEENKDYDEVIGNPDVPYINQLKAEGANFTKMYGEEHFSQGNYFWLFSGSDHDIGFFDHPPEPGSIDASNLGQQLIAKGLSFKGYAENLPEIGSTVDTAGESLCDTTTQLYARKHVPWISFANVPNGNTVETSCNLRFKDFPAHDFDLLPTVAIVIPNLDDDMHNCQIEESVPAGDRWLQEHMDAYYQWAKDNNSLLILTFDENNDKRHYTGLTDPFLKPDSCAHDSTYQECCTDLTNRTMTIFAGAHIKLGDYPEGRGITHVNILRTIEAMYGLPKSGAQQPNAARGGITDDYIITDVFEKQ